MISSNKIWEVLSAIPDPEIPVISILELGVLREVRYKNKELHITITPTYSGCPAMNQIESDIITKLVELGIEKYKINLQYHPAWTTDWIGEEARLKMEKHGIAPPNGQSADKAFLLGKGRITPCPRCKSTDTHLVSAFGSTACKAHFKCNACREPFDHFKCI